MQIRWFSRALDDLIFLRAYIAKDNPGAADQVALRIIESTEQLVAHPAMGRPGRVAGTRELVVAGTPYLMPYRVRGEVVEILRVLHAAQRWPEKF